MINRSHWTTSKTWQTNLAAKKLPHAHDTNGQQIPEASVDVTSLVFPAIGAILILLFGGFLLSSGNSCCHVDASNKKKNGDESEGIDFPYMDRIYFPKPFPVLQQENNDIVDAVIETYSDLPQYAPMNELMTSIPGIGRHTQQTETRDACVSPIHCLNSISTLLGNHDGHVVKSSYVDNQQDIHGNNGDNNDRMINHEELHENQEDGNDDLDREQTRLDCTIHIENNEDDKVADQSSTFNISSGVGSCSVVNTPALSVDSGLAEEDVRNLYIPIQLRKGKRTHSRANASALCIDSGGMSSDTRKAQVSDHLQEIKKTLNASFGLRETATTKPLAMDDGADKGDHESKQSALSRRFSVDNFVDNTSNQSGALAAKTAPYQWKRPMKLSKQDRLDILKRLQPNFNSVGSTNVDNVTANSSTSHKVEQRNVGGYIVNTYGGRLSCLRVERAPSSMCIHGNVCQYKCKSNHMTNMFECKKDDSGRGASYLGATPTPTPQGVVNTTHGVCEIDSHPRAKNCFVRGACELHDESVRGASAFDGSCCASLKIDDHTRGAREDDNHMRGASAFAEDDSNLHMKREQRASENDMDIRGASAFAENDPAPNTMQNHENPASKSNIGVTNYATSNYDGWHDLSLHTKSMQHQEILESKSNTLLDGCPNIKHGDDKKRTQFGHQKLRPSSKCNEKDVSMEFRGASGFGQSYADCLSIGGTASVTLSMAIQSEREDVTLASIAPKLQINGPDDSGLIEEQQTRKMHDEGKKRAKYQDKSYEEKDDTEHLQERQDLQFQNEGQHNRQLQAGGAHNETAMSVNQRVFNANSEMNIEGTIQPFCNTNMNKTCLLPSQKGIKSHSDSNTVHDKDLTLRNIEQTNQSHSDSNTVRDKNLLLLNIEQANQSHHNSKAVYIKSLSLLHANPELSNKSEENKKKSKPPQPEIVVVGSHVENTGSRVNHANKAIETAEILEARPCDVATNAVAVAVANAEKSSHTVATLFGTEDVVTKEHKSHAVVTGNISKVDEVANGYNLCAVKGKLHDVIINDQRSLEFNPGRSSTPYDNDVKSSLQSVPMTTKSDNQIFSRDKTIESKDGVAMTSRGDKNALSTKAPKMTLGKNSQALSGLLRALQREKLKKDCVTENVCVSSNVCVTISNSDFANGTVSVTDNECTSSNNHVTAKKYLGDENSVTDKDYVPSTDYTTGNSVMNKDCITDNNSVANKDNLTGYNRVTNKCGLIDNDCVTNRDCITDNNSRTSKTVFEKTTNENTRSDSPEGSDVTDFGRRKQVVGKLKVCLFYSNNNANKPVLYMTVLKASSLRQELVQSNEDLYIQMHVNTRDDKIQQTKSVSILSNTAVFNHLFQVHDITLRELRVSTIKLVLVSGQSKQEEAVANIPLAELVARDKIKKTYLLKKYSSQTKKINKKYSKVHIPVGSLYLGLKYNSVDEKLLVNITKARGLPSMTGWGQTDPYVILTVQYDGKTMDEKVTCTKWNQRNPQFDANFVLEISRERIETTSLLLRVMNNSANHSLIGAVKIGMESFEDSGKLHWESILDQNGVHDERWHKLYK